MVSPLRNNIIVGLNAIGMALHVYIWNNYLITSIIIVRNICPYCRGLNVAQTWLQCANSWKLCLWECPCVDSSRMSDFCIVTFLHNMDCGRTRGISDIGDDQPVTSFTQSDFLSSFPIICRKGHLPVTSFIV